ncbi:MAG: hypothetical protein ACPGTU_14230, partial [Myxococcota bacterium]
MGTIGHMILAFMVGLQGVAFGKPSVIAVLSAGPAVPGEIVQVDIATLEDGEAQRETAPTVSVNGGTISGPIEPLNDGRWRVRIRIGDKPATVLVSYNDASSTLNIRPQAFGDSAIVGPKRVEGQTRRPVSFQLKRRDGSS